MMNKLLELNNHFKTSTKYSWHIQDYIQSEQARFYGFYGEQAGSLSNMYAIYFVLNYYLF